MTFDPTIYRQRRARLLEKMQRGIAVIPTAEEVARFLELLPECAAAASG